MKNTYVQRRNINRNFLTAVIGILLIGGLVFLGTIIWRQYRDTMMETQKAQMLITAEAVSNDIENVLNVYADDAEILTGSSYKDNGDVNEDIFTEYLLNRDYVTNLILYDAGEKVVWEHAEETFPTVYVYALMRQTTVLFEVGKDNEGSLKFIFRKRLSDGGHLEIVMDIMQYYQLISKVRIGKNGYLVLKSSHGILFMYPDSDRLGMNVISGRTEQYPDLDLKSAENMILDQERGNTAVTEYISYGWTDPSLPRIKKISAYDPIRVGDDFLILSAVADYNDFYIPVRDGFYRIVAVLIGILAVVILFMVITILFIRREQKNAEEIRYLKDLNKVLEETHRSEETMAHQQRLQIMGTMTGGIVHEFNNLLTPIMGYADMLRSELPEQSDAQDNAQEIFDASEKARDIIRQISSLSRRNMETTFHFIEAEKLLLRSMKMIRTVCPYNIQLQTEFSFHEEGFLGNSTQMNQVFLNLCVNAFHAIGKQENGVVRITGTTVSRETLAACDIQNIPEVWSEYIRIDISDNGCGMDKATADQIFMPFFTTKANGQGTGLGLSIVDQIIHSHKGYIAVKSVKGEGSSFTLFIPSSGKASDVHREAEEKPSEENLQLLVVDKNAKILERLTKDFARIGIEIDTAVNTADAAALMEKKLFDVLVTDIALSKTGYGSLGIDFAMSVSKKYPDLIKVIMTDKAEKEVVEAKQKEIIDAYIIKPVSVSEIIATIRAVLKTREQNG